MGVGVAGLQAIATARRLGGVVTATDVRPATKEQVESLGAKFLPSRTRNSSRRRQRAATPRNVRRIQGQAGRADRHAHRQAGHCRHHRADPRPSRAKLITAEMVARCGRLGDRRSRGRARRQLRIVEAGRDRRYANDVKIVGHLNVAGRLAATASQLYAKNLYAFLETLIDKDAKSIKIDPEESWSRRRC